MKKQEQTDSDWLRLQRTEHDRRAWLWSRLKTLGTWIASIVVSLSAGVGGVEKILEWWNKK